MSRHLSLSFFFFNDTATTEIYTLSLHDALPISIEQALYQVRNRSFQDPLNFPPGPLERISGLVGVVAGTDARPTAQSYDVFRIFAADIQKQLVALKLALGRDLPALNRALRSASAAAIAPRAAEVRPPAAERPASGSRLIG